MWTEISGICFLFAIIMAIPISLEDQWKNFKANHGKTYSLEEEQTRFKIFKENLQKIEEHNKKYETGEVTFKMGINQFADLAPDEFKKNYLGFRLPHEGRNKES